MSNANSSKLNMALIKQGSKEKIILKPKAHSLITTNGSCMNTSS